MRDCAGNRQVLSFGWQGRSISKTEQRRERPTRAWRYVEQSIIVGPLLLPSDVIHRHTKNDLT